MNDPFLSEDLCYQRLKQDYITHKKLLIAADFDDCIFDYHRKGFKFPQVIQLLQDCNKVGFDIVIYSASPRERHPEIQAYCELNNIKIEAINENIAEWIKDGKDRSKAKIYYNILLDDKAGLPTTYRILRKLVDEILRSPATN